MNESRDVGWMRWSRATLWAPLLGLALGAQGVAASGAGSGTPNSGKLQQCALVLEGASPAQARADALAQARALLAEVRDPLPAEKVGVRWLESRVALAEGRVADAAEGFASCLESRVPVPAEVFVGAMLGAVECYEAQGDRIGGARQLLQFFKSGRELPDAEPVFQKLVSLLSEMADPLEADLRDCPRIGPAAHRALAQFYLSQFYFAVGKTGRALEEARVFCETYPDHALRAAACLQRAERAMESAQWSEAEVLLKEGRTHCRDSGLERVLALRQALVAFRKGDFKGALSQWTKVGEQWPEAGVEAGFNAGLAAVRMGDFRRASALQVRLLSEAGGGMLSTELELEIALRRAVERLPQAEELLESFIRNHPQSPRLGEARVALAECYAAQARENLAAAGPRSGRSLQERAGGLLKVAATDPLPSQTSMQARYLSLFLADAQQPRDEAEVVRIGEDFLKEYPDSKLCSEVRMKLGEVYLRRGDSAGAEAQFAMLSTKDADGPLAEAALFLAGQCASNLLNPGSVDRALAYWDKVAAGKGPLRWKARYQQAAVKSRLGEEQEGAVLFELIVRAPEGVDADLRLAAQCGRADALLALARRGTGSLEVALGEYAALAESGEASSVWRNQALYKMGKALERTNPQGALEKYEKVLANPATAEGGEFFWSYKAGFDAARLHESRGAWREAVAAYEGLAALTGPRSQEARSRARQLRLERFIWD